MKAILVIDMPSNGCKSCMFGFNNQRCLVKAYMTDDKMNDSDYCPLKPMPNEACETLMKGLDAMEKMKSVEVKVVRRTE